MRKLVLSGASGSKETFDLKDGITVVGRDTGADVVIVDASVSRRHATISLTRGGFVLEDLGSKNGTMLNGRPIRKATLAPGDSIHFGDVRAEFSETDQADSSIAEETFLFRRDDLSKALFRLHFIYDLAEAAATEENQDAIIRVALDILRRELEAEHVYLGLLDKDGFRIESESVLPEGDPKSPLPFSGTLLERAVQSKSGLLIRDARADKNLREQASVLDSGARSVLAVPMMIAGRTMGVFYADTRSRVRPFTKDDVAFAAALAGLLGVILRNLQTMTDLRRRNRALQEKLEGLELIGDAPVMEHIRKTIRNFAEKGEAPVLIQGQSGTGKELAARLIHRLSSRAHRPFLDVNCAAVPEQLIESELFGHVKGAFTSASRDHRGLFEMAEGGVLFLDEIGEMPLELQSKLLRVLETREFRPVGSEKVKNADVRVVAATNQNLEEKVARGHFRKDLFYRLKVLFVEMPPLSSHPEDIPALVDCFLKELSVNVATQVQSIDEEAMTLLQSHGWPGNVRELRNVLERALYCCETKVIGMQHLEGFESEVAQPDSLPYSEPQATGPLENQIEDLEKSRILQALEEHRWNRTKAAQQLGIARKTLINKIKKYNL